MSIDKQPVLFLSHGGGPNFYMDEKDEPFVKGFDKNSAAAGFLRNLRSTAGVAAPKAILVISAHWEEKTCTVSTSPKPSLYFDYGGFPDYTYKLEWSVPGAPQVAKRTRQILIDKGIPCEMNDNRGLDHGVFVPLKLAFPEAHIPVFQLSLMNNLNVEQHVSVGEALQCLRDEGVLIVGSGFTTHNLSTMRNPSNVPPSWLLPFKAWVTDLIANSKHSITERKKILLQSQAAPGFKSAHPRIEHYLPLVVVMAAANYNNGHTLYEEIVFGSGLFSCYKFD